MKEKDLVEMINGIDDDLIEEAESSGARGNKAPRRAFPGGLRVAAVAAVLFAIVLSVLLAFQYQQKGSSKPARSNNEPYTRALESSTRQTDKKPSGGASHSEVLLPPNSFLPFYGADSVVYGTIIGKGSSALTNPDYDLTLLNKDGDVVPNYLVTDYTLQVEESIYGTPEHNSIITIKVSNYVLEENEDIEDYFGPTELEIGKSGFFFLGQSGILQPAGEEPWYIFHELFSRIDTRDELFYNKGTSCALDPWILAEQLKAFKTLTKKNDKWKFIGSPDFREQIVLEAADANDPLLKAKDDGVTAPTPRVALDGADIIVEGKIIEEMPAKVVDSRRENTAGNPMNLVEIPQYVLRVDRVLRGDGAAIGEEITVGVENYVGDWDHFRYTPSGEEEEKLLKEDELNRGISEVTFSEGKSGIFCLSYSEAYTDNPGDGIYLVVRRDDGVFEKGDDGVYRSANTVLTPEIMEEYGLLDRK